MVFQGIAVELDFLLQGDHSITKRSKDRMYVLNVILDLFREYDDVFDVKEADVPFEARKDDVKPALKGCCVVGEAEEHERLLECSSMEDEGGF